MITKDNTYKVLQLFFQEPEKSFHIRQIARLTGLSAPGVSKMVARLRKDGLLTMVRGKVVQDIRASRTDRFLHLKRCWNIERLFETGLVDSLRTAYEKPEAIVLFGSFSKGEDTSISDIDIAVIAPEERRLRLEPYQRALKRKINMQVVQLKRAEPAFLNSLANGVVLYGFLKVVKE